VVEVAVAGRSANELDALAHAADPPVIGTIRAGRFRLDPRTLAEAEIEEAADALARAWRAGGAGEGAGCAGLDPSAGAHGAEPAAN
jgi:hypothetical protein